MEVLKSRNNGKVIEYEDNSMYDVVNNVWINSSVGLDDEHYIYSISDINGSIYVGETSLELEKRLALHKSEIGKCAAKELNLEKSEIELLEICKKRDKETCEFNWIQNYKNCINYNKVPLVDFEQRQNKRTYQHFYMFKHGQYRNEKQNADRAQVRMDKELPFAE